ncbi:MAG TPA: DUF2203 domain-containing protein [Acidimicrobiales bacterium]|nr:DUF2203 domain-containing protein [Acidimicrobiales bacterium]
MRYWTEQEARDYLPRLRTLLGVIRRATQLEVRARGNGHATIPGAKAPPSEKDAAPSSDLDAEAALRELDEHGIILRDPQRGLIDFPSRHSGGRDVLLCWQLGEDDLAWWHLPEDGFAGRKPLPMPPEL